MKIISNYHDYSVKLENKYQDELLSLLGILLVQLNDVKTLTPAVIDQIIKQWRLQHWEDLNAINKSTLINLDSYINKIITFPKPAVIPFTSKIKEVLANLIKKPQVESQNAELIVKLFDANNQMLNITIDYIESKYKELSVLENTYNYDKEQSNLFLNELAQSVEHKITTFITQSTINNMRELLFTTAKQQKYTEYYWHTQRDKRVRHSHAAMDGKWFRLDDRSPQPAGYQPGEDYNCRCYSSMFR